MAFHVGFHPDETRRTRFDKTTHMHDSSYESLDYSRRRRSARSLLGFQPQTHLWLHPSLAHGILRRHLGCQHVPAILSREKSPDGHRLRRMGGNWRCGNGPGRGSTSQGTGESRAGSVSHAADHSHCRTQTNHFKVLMAPLPVAREITRQRLECGCGVREAAALGGVWSRQWTDPEGAFAPALSHPTNRSSKYGIEFPTLASHPLCRCPPKTGLDPMPRLIS